MTSSPQGNIEQRSKVTSSLIQPPHSLFERGPRAEVQVTKKEGNKRTIDHVERPNEQGERIDKADSESVFSPSSGDFVPFNPALLIPRGREIVGASIPDSSTNILKHRADSNGEPTITEEKEEGSGADVEIQNPLTEVEIAKSEAEMEKLKLREPSQFEDRSAILRGTQQERIAGQ